MLFKNYTHLIFIINYSEHVFLIEIYENKFRLISYWEPMSVADFSLTKSANGMISLEENLMNLINY